MEDFKKNNENYNLCANCGGQCCKTLGCHYSPRDFTEISYDILDNLLSEGNTSIDWWEGDVTGGDRYKTYFIRMRNANSPIVDPSWGGECILLTDKGCPLPFGKRPMGGRALIPRKNGSCQVGYSKEECCREWYEYQSLLEQLVKKYKAEG